MERADEGQGAGAEQRVPADDGDDRLVDVSDVVTAAAQLPAQGEDRAGGARYVRDGAVGGQPERASKRDEALGRLPALRARTAVQTA